jgi:hypothetical protein
MLRKVVSSEARSLSASAAAARSACSRRARASAWAHWRAKMPTNSRSSAENARGT